MVHAIEFTGRLCGPDGRFFQAGSYDLCLRLHTDAEGEAILWEEIQTGVPTSATGQFHLVLGGSEPLEEGLFDAPRYLSVRLVRDGRIGEEACERVALSGLGVRVASAITSLERTTAPLGRLADAVRVSLRRTRILRRHVRTLEQGGGPIASLDTRINALEARLSRLDAEEGRVTHIEDELEDIVGPDGDVVDLTERMDALEQRVRMIDRLAGLEQRLNELEARLNSR